MISCKALGHGRMGNNMFAIAALKAYSLRYGVDGVIPPWKYAQYFEGPFNQSENISDYPEYAELRFAYDEIPKWDNIDLIGYYQSELYFLDFQEDIRKLFTLKDDVQGAAQQFISSECGTKTPVSLHIRRGDYLNHPTTHPTCTIEYYKQAMWNFGDDCHFFVMTDDLEWAEKNIVLKGRVSFCGFADIMDFCVGVNCSHNIISNSSFSWWQAWLNPNPNKIVIAPKIWFGEAANHDTKDLIPNTWKTI